MLLKQRRILCRIPAVMLGLGFLLIQVAPPDSLTCYAQSEPSEAKPDESKDQPKANPGQLTQVTLYRDQALVTREIEVEANDAEQLIFIGRLPSQVVSNSVFAEGTDAVQVGGVRVRPQASRESDSAEVRELRRSLTEVDREMASVQNKLSSVQKQASYIDGLMGFSADTSNVGMNRGVLDTEALIKLSEFVMSSQAETSEQIFEFTLKLKDLERQQEQLNEQLRLLTRPAEPTYEASVRVRTTNDQGGLFRLSYLVSGCSWTPLYNIRGTWESNEFELRYTALVEQMSGEDWNDVQLALSTASPSISAAGPVLTPFRVATSTGPNGAAQTGQIKPGLDGELFETAENPATGYGGYGGGEGGYGGMGGYGDAGYGGLGGMGGMAPQQQLQEKSRALKRRQAALANRFSNAQSDADNMNRDLALNSLANQFQSLELQADATQVKTLAEDTDAEVSSQSYQIDGAITLSSRREQQTVLIENASLTGSLYYVATPLLSSYAYREADIANSLAVGLLGGPATVYLDGRFVGRTEIPSVAAGQNFSVGFGADQQVRTRRQLLSKQDETQGGNRRLTFKYRLVVANFKDRPVTLRMLDRMPVAAPDKDVSIQYDDSQWKLSEDGMYRRIQYPRGILRWDVEVPANRFAENAFDLDYQYTIEFDRTLNLGAVGNSNPQVERDLLEFSAPAGGMGGGMGGMGGGY